MCRRRGSTDPWSWWCAVVGRCSSTSSVRSTSTCSARCRIRSWRTRAALFFFQAEDGIRDKLVTGVQTCALPISRAPRHQLADAEFQAAVWQADREQRMAIRVLAVLAHIDKGDLAAIAEPAPHRRDIDGCGDRKSVV